MAKKKLKKRPLKQSKKSRPQIPVTLIRVLAILLIVFVTSIGYWFIFDEKIDLNGDNTAYYLLGESIHSGEGYASIWNINQSSHSHYPVGYPMLIALFMFISESMVFIKIMNFVFFLAMLALLFRFTEKLFSNMAIAFWAVLLVALNGHLLRFSTIMMSEIPFLFFSLVVLYALTQLDFTKNPFKQKGIYILIFSLAFAYHIRTIGIAMIFGAGVYLIYRRQWKYLVVTFGGTLLLMLPWAIRNTRLGSSSYINQLLMINPYRSELGNAGFFDLVERVFNNLFRYISLEIPNASMPFLQTVISNGNIYGWITGILFMGLVVFGLYRMQKYRTLILAYLFGIFSILLLWPDVWFGIRFIIPVLPLLVILAVYALFELGKIYQSRFPWSRNIVIMIILGSLFLMAGALKFEKAKANNPYPPAYKNYFRIAKWMKTNTEKNAIVCCRKGSIFNIFSERLTTKYKYTKDSDEIINQLDRYQVDFVVVEQLGYGSTPRYLVPAIQKNSQRFQQVIHLKNPDTYLLKFNKRK